VLAAALETLGERESGTARLLWSPLFPKKLPLALRAYSCVRMI
jgi:hypothetical protein